MKAKNDIWWEVKRNLITDGVLSRQDEGLIDDALYKLTVAELIVMDILLCELVGEAQTKRQRDYEEYQFLAKVLHLPFFEFCLRVKERKEKLRERLY